MPAFAPLGNATLDCSKCRRLRETMRDGRQFAQHVKSVSQWGEELLISPVEELISPIRIKSRHTSMDASLWLECSVAPLMHGDVEADSLQAILDLLDDSVDSGDTLIQEILYEDAMSDASSTASFSTAASSSSSPSSAVTVSSQLALAPRPTQWQKTSVPTEKKRYKESGSTRVRNELMVLRTEAKELEAQLELVRSRRSKARSSAGSLTSADVVYRGQKISIWRSVAQRQHRARREAEAMNERLRVTVEEQRKITQQFLRSLKRGSTLLEAKRQETATTTTEVEPTTMMTKHIRDIVDYDDMVEASMCETLLNKVDWLMIQATDVFNHPEFQSSDSISQQTTYGDAGMVSVIDSRVVPFDCAATSNAIWKYYSDRTTEPAQFPFKPAEDPDLMIKGFRMTLGSAFQIGHVQGMIVGRRFEENGRVVIVWAADITPALDVPGSGFLSAKIAEHLSFRAHGWSAVSQLGSVSTKIQMKHCVSPKTSSSGGGLGVMLQMVLKLVSQGLCEHHETIHRRVDDAFVIAEPKTDAWSASSALSSLFTSAPCVTLESW